MVLGLVIVGSVVSAPGPKANYAINPTPELDLRTNRAVLPARVIAALAFAGKSGSFMRFKCGHLVYPRAPWSFLVLSR